MKKKFQIISLLFSVIGLLYLILSYNGYIRYLSLHIYPVENYISEYPKIPKSEKRVVVAYNVDKNNIDKISPSVKSILDQGIRVDDIGLTLPYSLYGSVNGDLKKVLSLYGYSKNYEDSQNLVCSVLREPDGETSIILLDPEIVYGEDFIETMINAGQTQTDKVIYSENAILVKPKFFDEKLTCPDTTLSCKEWLEKCSKSSGIQVIEYKNNRKRL